MTTSQNTPLTTETIAHITHEHLLNHIQPPNHCTHHPPHSNRTYPMTYINNTQTNQVTAVITYHHDHATLWLSTPTDTIAHYYADPAYPQNLINTIKEHAPNPQSNQHGPREGWPSSNE